jgi:hypothetical protein
MVSLQQFSFPPLSFTSNSGSGVPSARGVNSAREGVGKEGRERPGVLCGSGGEEVEDNLLLHGVELRSEERKGPFSDCS